jgi:hypothetical protein
MTIISLQLLAHFLNLYPQQGRVADYGGTDRIGGKMVKKMLSLSELAVSPGTNTKGFSAFLNGKPRKPVPEYICLDYDNGVDLLKPIKGKKFDGGLCMDLLEHTTNPFIVAKNISDSLNKGAYLFVTVPWVWEIHNYPGDYWRFTPQGLETLFPKLKKVTIEIIRDSAPEEELPRHRLVAIFKKK